VPADFDCLFHKNDHARVGPDRETKSVLSFR